MSDEELTFSDTIQIVMPEEEEEAKTPIVTVAQEEKKDDEKIEESKTSEESTADFQNLEEQNDHPLDLEVFRKVKEVKKEIIKPVSEQKKDLRNQDIQQIKNKIEKNRLESSKEKSSNTSRKSIVEMTLDMYTKKFDEYAHIPDCIVNKIFNLFYEKNEMMVEECLLILQTILPNSKQDIDNADTLNEAIYVAKLHICMEMYNECKDNFNNIPSYSRRTFANKISKDYEDKKLENIIYDYQLMKLTGYIK